MNEIKKVSWQEYSHLLKEQQKKIDEFIGYNLVTLCERGDTLNHPEIDIQVSWASIGAVTADEALKFADAIRFAAEIAKTFPYNGYLMDYKIRR